MLSINTKKHLQKLQQKKYRTEYGEFIIEGVKGVEEALRCGQTIQCILVEQKKAREPGAENLLTVARKKGIETYEISEAEASSLKTTDVFPGILAVVKIEKVASLNQFDLTQPIIALDRLNDPGNLGTIIRTADWFGVPQIILSEDSVEPFNPKVARSTMGSIFRTKLFESTNIVQDIEFLKNKGYTVVSLGMAGKNIDSLRPAPKTVYLFGSESHGIRPELEKISQAVYTIPGRGGAESLNVGVAAGILLSKFF